MSTLPDRISAARDRIGRVLLRAADGLLPRKLRGGECEHARRGRLAIGASLIIAACGLLTSVFATLQGRVEILPPVLGVAAAAALIPALLRLTGSVGLAGHAIPIAVFAGLVLTAVRGGGQLGLPFILLPGVPILASLIVNMRAGLAWAGIAALGLGALAIAMRSGLAPSVPADAALIQKSLFYGSAVMLPFVMLLVWAYESARRRALAHAREAQREAERRGSELDRANRELAELNHVAAHELKEPLRGLNSCAAFLIEDLGDHLGSEALRRAETLRRLTERMDSLIDALRRVAAIKPEVLFKENVPVQETLEDALERIDGSLAERGASIRLESPLPVIHCDRALLRTVIENLVGNAVQFNASTQVAVSIGVLRPETEDDEPEMPVLYVRDNGLGISEDCQKHVFRIFKRLHARPEEGGGSGVGMALVKKIIDLHGGKIWLDSTPGEGTTVFFSLGSESTESDG